jgi:hypothetical protein
MFAEIPHIFTSVVNELLFVPGLARSKLFEWMFHRSVVYIPKPDKIADRPENLRPLSLLECFYKIHTRILTHRLATCLPEVISPDQHGFIAQRSCQTAILPVLEAISDADYNNKSLQILSLDISSAFDTIKPGLIRDTMILQSFPPIFVDALHGFTNSGTAQIEVNGTIGDKVTVTNGSGQGDPPSASRYIIGTDACLRALSNVTEDFRYCYRNGMKTRPGGYADDNIVLLQARNAQDVKSILDMFEHFATVSGLHVSPVKSEILFINTPERLEQEITRATSLTKVSEMRYLGVFLSDTYEKTVQITQTKTQSKVAKKMMKIQSAHMSTFHKVQLINQAVLPTFNHIAMVMDINHDNSWWDKEVCKTLWGKIIQGETTQGRRLVAKNRIRSSYKFGGLQIADSQDMAQGLLLNFMQKMLRGGDCFIFEYYNDIIQGTGFESLLDMSISYGPRIWDRFSRAVKGSSRFLSGIATAYSRMLLLNENSVEGWFSASVVGHSQSVGLIEFNRADCLILREEGISQVGDLFPLHELRAGRDMTSDFRFSEHFIERYPGLVQKCKFMRKMLGRGKRPIKGLVIGFYQSVSNIKFSKLLRTLSRERTDSLLKGPPSYFTRQSEGYALPSLNNYMQGYNNIMAADVPLRSKEISFQIMNRQCWTNQKAYWAGMSEGSVCDICGETENTYHLLMGCEGYSSIIWATLRDIVNDWIGKDVQFTTYQVLYGQRYIGIGKAYGKFLYEITMEIKRGIIVKRMSRAINPNLSRVRQNKKRVAAHIIQFTNSLEIIREIQKRKTELLAEFRQRLADYISK